MRPGVALIGACFVVSAGAARSDTLADQLAHCAAITANETRLACYDALGGRVGAKAPATPVSTAPAPSSQTNFGLTVVQQQKTAPQQKQLDSITATVLSISTSALGRMVVALDNGEAWELDSADPLLSAGSAVAIARGALGSFLMTTPSKRSHHVRRLH